MTNLKGSRKNVVKWKENTMASCKSKMRTVSNVFDNYLLSLDVGNISYKFYIHMNFICCKA